MPVLITRVGRTTQTQSLDDFLITAVMLVAGGKHGSQTNVSNASRDMHRLVL